MNTKINITYKDVPYVLEYNRYAIKAMEAAGFVLEDFRKSPMTSVDLAFQGLFVKNHKNTKESVITEIYNALKDKEKLIEKMLEMIGETYNSLLDDSSGNLTWDVAEMSPNKD